MVGGLHRAFVFEVGCVPHAADNGAGSHLLGEFAREPRVNPGFDTRIPGIEVVDQPFAVGDGQQTLFRGVVADADDYAVEEVEGLVDQCRMAAGERVERPGENSRPFHIGQR